MFGIWLPERNPVTNRRLEKLGDDTFSWMLTRSGVSDSRPGTAGRGWLPKKAVIEPSLHPFSSRQLIVQGLENSQISNQHGIQPLRF